MKLKLLALAMFSAAVAFGAGGSASAETLMVGAYPANPPWENKKEDGTFEGFEVDLVNEIGKRIGADIEFQDLGFQALFAATSSGRVDMAISSITITDERLQNQAFSPVEVEIAPIGLPFMSAMLVTPESVFEMSARSLS